MTLSNRKPFIVIMLFLCGVLNYLDRSALAITSIYIRDAFNLTVSQLGILFSSFSVGYVLFNIIGGIFADKFKTRDVLLIAVIAWSFFSGAVAISTSFISLLAIRIIFGMAEGPLSTTTNKIIDSLYPADKKTSIVGISASGTALGAAVSGPIVGFIAIKYGWKLSFIFIMLIGFIWAFLWWKYIKDSFLKANNNKETEQEIISSTKIQRKLKISFYLKQKVIIATSVAFFAYNYILFFFLTWFPHYLIAGRSFSLEMTSIINIIPWTLGFIALASGGIISDFIMSRLLGSAKDPLISRKIIIGFGLLISAIAVFLVEFVGSDVMAISLVSVAVFFLYLTGSVYWGVINDIVDTSNVGSAGGVMHGFGNCAGILGPLATGFIIHFTGKFMAAFALAGIIGFIGSSGAFLFIRRIKIDKERIKKYIAVK